MLAKLFDRQEKRTKATLPHEWYRAGIVFVCARKVGLCGWLFGRAPLGFDCQRVRASWVSPDWEPGPAYSHTPSWWSVALESIKVFKSLTISVESFGYKSRFDIHWISNVSSCSTSCKTAEPSGWEMASLSTNFGRQWGASCVQRYAVSILGLLLPYQISFDNDNFRKVSGGIRMPNRRWLSGESE